MDNEYPYHAKLFCKVIDIFAINKEFGGKSNNTANLYKTFYNILTNGNDILFDIYKCNSNKDTKIYELFSNITLVDLITSDKYECFSRSSFNSAVFNMTDYSLCDYYHFEVGYFLSYIRNSNKEIYEFYNNKYKKTKYNKFYKIAKELNNKYRNEGKEIEFSVVQWPYFPMIFMDFTDIDNISNDIMYVRKYMAKNLDPPGLNEDYIGVEGIYENDTDSLKRDFRDDHHGHLLTHWK